MRHKLIIVALATLALTACVSIPTTADQFRAQQSEVTTVCSQRSVEETTNRLVKAWSRCYEGPGLSEIAIVAGRVPFVVPLGNSGSTRVDVAGTENGTTVLLRLPSNQIPLMADIRVTDSCPAQVVVRGVQALWISSAKNTETWLNNPEASGPALACK